MKLHLNLADISSSLDTQRPISHHFNTHRPILRKGIDPAVVQSCLDSLDVFKDLLQGMPHQKNRVVRDVCKNIEVKSFQQGDLIYDIGDKSQAVYFCLSGTVSICIVKQIPKQVNNQSQPLPINSSRNQPLNTPKSIQNLLTLSTMNSSTLQTPSIEYQKVDQQIDCIESGEGFGQAQFISQTKRTVKAKAKQQHVIVGKLQIDHFAEVLQNYKQRVYYKKRDMFQKCALFKDLPINKLQFIINNTKPMTINISHKLIRQGSSPDIIYLVNKGQISLWRTGFELDEISNISQQPEETLKKSNTQNISTIKKYKSNKVSLAKIALQTEQKEKQQKDEQQEQQKQKQVEKVQKFFKHNQVYSSILKRKKSTSPLPKKQDNKILMGLLSQSSFIGDMELAMGTTYKFNAICKTEKAQVYYCDRRIILSQMTSQNIIEACKYYKSKQSYLNQKIQKYRQAKQKIQEQKQIDLLPPLTKDQIKLKRKLMHRYVEEKGSLIGHSSPADIEKMIKIKEKRLIKQPEVSPFPILQIFPNHSVKKRQEEPTLSPRSFKPLPYIQGPGRKCITEFDQYSKNDSSSQKNPELKHSDQVHKFQSVIIQIKPSSLNLSDLKYGKQKNMAIVGQILGRYKKCQNKFQSISSIVEKIQNGKA